MIVYFGIAVKTRSRRLTFGKLSDLMGTPEYISPEQVQGKQGDARSDIYALEIILYEMFTGRLPFAGSNAFAIMNDRMLNHPVPPREIDPTIPPELEEIVFRAIERNPSQRYASARDLGPGSCSSAASRDFEVASHHCCFAAAACPPGYYTHTTL